jgi:Glycosyl transferase family 11
MITCKLRGGLGNQLFQIFTAIAYAITYSKSFFFLNNQQLGNGDNGSTIRYTYWNTFLVALKPFLKSKEEIPSLLVIKENSFAFQPLVKIDDKDHSSLLVGYYQSPRYFDAYKHQICKLIKLDMVQYNVKNKVNIHITSDINMDFTNVVSIHFRFGDYKKYPNVYPLLTESYYIETIKYIEENKKKGTHLNNGKVLYFYDPTDKEDVSTVESIIEALKHMYPSLEFIHIDGLEDWEELVLMSLCPYHIIANSTFSWWGAYLNSHPSSIVCYPSKWFANDTVTKDLFPDSWTKINV